MWWSLVLVLWICLGEAKVPVKLERIELWPEKDTGKVRSTGFPATAPANTKQKWIINGVPNSIIHLRCKRIVLLGLCKDSNITRIDGRSAGLICGDDHDDFEYTSMDSTLELTLTNGDRGGNIVDCSVTSSMKWGIIPLYLYQEKIDIDSTEYGIGPDEDKTTCPCGWTNKAIDSRIIGGIETGVNEYPLIASLIEIKTKTDTGIAYNRFCGGAIISNWHVLTAAHCTIDYVNDPSREIAIIVGDHDYTTWKETDANVLVKVRDIKNHESYNPKKDRYDISLITTRDEIKFNQKVGPACLPKGVSFGEDLPSFEGKHLKAIGWGLTSYPGKGSNVLMESWFKVLSLEVCREQYVGSVDMINEHQLCLFSKDSELCMGDSGGPILWLNPATNRYTLVGLVSFGKDCSSFYPDVVTDVRFFVSWIQQNIQRTHPAATCTAR